MAVSQCEFGSGQKSGIVVAMPWADDAHRGLQGCRVIVAKRASKSGSARVGREKQIGRMVKMASWLTWRIATIART